MTERAPMQGKSFLNHISIGGFNLGEALDPNNNLDKLGNAVQSGDIGGIVECGRRTSSMTWRIASTRRATSWRT